MSNPSYYDNDNHDPIIQPRPPQQHHDERYQHGPNLPVRHSVREPFETTKSEREVRE